jgi:hypothetical protein
LLNLCVAEFHGLNFARLEFRFNPARAHDTPAADGFKKSEQTRRHQNDSQPEIVVNDDDARDQAERADDAARDASAMVDVGSEKAAHTRKLAQRVPNTTGSLQEKLANGRKLLHIFARV